MPTRHRGEGRARRPVVVTSSTSRRAAGRHRGRGAAWRTPAPLGAEDAGSGTSAASTTVTSRRAAGVGGHLEADPAAADDRHERILGQRRAECVRVVDRAQVVHAVGIGAGIGGRRGAEPVASSSLS
jgi:hypothetical protein